MFANRVIRGVTIPSVALYVVAVIAIVLYGFILRATKTRDFLGKTIFNHPLLQNFDGWSVTHFLFFGLLGVLYPGRPLQFLIVGAGWEVIETLLGQYKFGMTGSRLQLIGEQDDDGNLTGNEDAYWYGKESDIVVDMAGYCLGSAWAERYWPNPPDGRPNPPGGKGEPATLSVSDFRDERRGASRV